MRIFDFFIDTKNDSQTVLIDSDKTITRAELKQYIYHRKKEFLNTTCENVVLLGENHFDFIVNFWAGIFAEKNLYLISDKKRLNSLDIEYILPSKAENKSDFFSFDIPQIKDVIFFTSGSTGQPKKIIKNSEIILKEGIDIFYQFKEHFRENSTFFTTSDPTHMFILSFYFLLPFLSNFIIDIRKVEFPEQIQQWAKKNSVLITTPSFLKLLKKYYTNIPKNIYLFFSAGSALSNEIQNYIEEKAQTINIFGSTETGNIAYKLSSQDPYFTLFDKVQIINKGFNFAVKSSFFIEEELELADNLEIINNRQIILKNRTDRLVKIQEKRISLIELETKLKEHSFVQDAYTFLYNSKLCGAIVLTQKGKDYLLQNTNLNLQKTLKQYLNNFFETAPNRWKFLPEIPTNTRGKTDITLLENIFGTNLSFPLVLDTMYNENEINIKLSFLKSSNFLNGHFKIFPIVPGVVQLYYAQYFIQTLMNINIPIGQIKRIKFSNVITPQKTINLKLKNNEHSVYFEYSNQEKELYSSGNFTKINLK